MRIGTATKNASDLLLQALGQSYQEAVRSIVAGGDDLVDTRGLAVGIGELLRYQRRLVQIAKEVAKAHEFFNDEPVISRFFA
jgi:hypothetical protein